MDWTSGNSLEEVCGILGKKNVNQGLKYTSKHMKYKVCLEKGELNSLARLNTVDWSSGGHTWSGLGLDWRAFSGKLGNLVFSTFYFCIKFE